MNIKWSEARNELAAALAVAQGQMKTAKKDNVAEVKMSSGGKFSYKYSTLDDIWAVARKPLSDNGLSVIQIPVNGESGFYLETTLLHSSGQWVSGTMKIPVTAGRMSELQAMGSAITYARRYMLGAIVGVTTGDDDDGNMASDIGKENGEIKAYGPPQDFGIQEGEWSPPENWRPTLGKFFGCAIDRLKWTKDEIAAELKLAGYKGANYDPAMALDMWRVLEKKQDALETKTDDEVDLPDTDGTVNLPPH
jgi:hypothetical protein